MATITGPGLTQVANPNTYVQAPTRLTSVFPVKQADSHIILAGVTYELDACGDSYDEVDFDDYDDCIRTAAKTFDEGLLFADSITGPLALLAALKCRPGALGGGAEADYDARARRRLARLETTFLEAKLSAWVLANGTEATGGTDLPTTIATLLTHAADVNNPTLHLPIGLAFQLGTDLDNLPLFGVGLVVSPSYADDTAMLTGSLNIWGGETQVTTVPQPELNYIMAMAERQYVMAVECEPYYATVA